MEYTLRRSRRAKYLKVRVSPQIGVELVVPHGVSEARATRFLLERLDWIHATRARMGWLTNTGPVIPDSIELPPLQETWRLRRDRVARLRDRAGLLLIPLDWSEIRAAAGLRDWLRGKARRFLDAYCAGHARRSGLEYARLRVGLQSSRWGSYSGTGTLSLNAKLMLMPEPVLRYVVLHELVHSLHMDHSATFWRALARLEPDWRNLRQQLRSIGADLPGWVQKPAGNRRARRLRVDAGMSGAD